MSMWVRLALTVAGGQAYAFTQVELVSFGTGPPFRGDSLARCRADSVGAVRHNVPHGELFGHHQSIDSVLQTTLLMGLQ